MKRDFQAFGDDRYRLTIPDITITLEIDRLRREHHELIGELSVWCDLPGARTVDGSLQIANLNLSSARARQDWAKHLATRANAGDLDWTGLIEEFCQRVLQADRAGQPAVDLRTLPETETDDQLRIEGFAFPRRHPTIIYGDGGAVKSYTALWLAGKLVERGLSVALFDWELAGDDHRGRLERLFPDGMPRILYCRCERPLIHEADRLRRIVRESGIDYSIFDSVAFACDGPPEAAEVAGRYFRAVRQIGGGSLHIAHVNRSENADEKPFGSTFWHNGSRATWFVKRADEGADSDVISLGFFNKKANLGRLQRPIGFTVSFADERTTFRRADVADSPDLARKLTIRERMMHLLRRGAMTAEAIAEEIEADPETVRRTIRRHKTMFTVMEGGRVGLPQKGVL
ncbi:MAG: hypothetical protein ABSF25_21740 [Bryobacteraceae bacterium]